jgi:hypothetical protein
MFENAKVDNVSVRIQLWGFGREERGKQRQLSIF